MKYMNNHYGYSRIFGHSRFKIPMNIQLFAEGGEGAGDSGDIGGSAGTDGSASGDSSDSSDGDGSPTVEELLAQLAEERASAEALKRNMDKAAKDAANYKRQLNDKMSAQERIDAAQKEQYEAMQNELNELKRDKLISTYVEQCMDESISMNKETAKAFSEALVNGDSEKAFSSLGKHIVALKKAWQEEFYANNPQLNAGNNSEQDDPSIEFVKRQIEAKKKHAGNSNDILKRFM